ncbi:MAG: hypothetical protein AAGA87_02545 [Pseudomonadota bacterium]
MIDFDPTTATVADLEAMLAQIGTMEAPTGAGADQLAALIAEIEGILADDGGGGPVTFGDEIFDSPEAQELLDQMAALGFSMMMQSMSDTMSEVQKIALEL